MKPGASALCCTSVGVLVVAVLAPVIYIYMLEHSTCECGDNDTGRKQEDTQLVIGILSAREHFEQRQAVRDTWLQDIHKGHALEKVLYKFIIGSRSCDIHVQNRKDLYSCEQLNFTYATNLKHDNQNIPLVSLKNIEESDLNVNTDRRFSIIWNTSVIIRHSVIIKRIGLHVAVPLSEEPIIVQLYDENTEAAVLSARFSLLDPGISAGTNSDITAVSYRFQSVSHVLLPKHYECSLRIIFDGAAQTRSKLLGSLTNLVSINNSGGTVELLPIDEKGFYVQQESENKIFLGNLLMAVNDVDELEMVQNSQALLNEEHQADQEEISCQIQKENSIYNDILLVNVTDVYRNLPLKLLHFHQWIHSEINAQYVMKTDDDCFVDVEKIMTLFDTIPKVNKIWWGNFRENWFVERMGKWAEKTYRASEYPQFACGSGNIVSKDISDWLARNAEVLFPFQGEDTSMGIWLSALGTRYIENKEWFCDKGCDKNAFVIPQLSVNEMQSLWTNKQQCDNICGCK
ncbi:UDP-GalNAc:beta-1,3-N-acetylgalactosaminyltransferase 2-like [Mercenaria mercenaria]|uniref:UDP-GalNAc:beta-1, 3-N-acetylgalactosaminyltransferase 2-like n=1 Tax=Mercenaria mercenaria TaxID=6596 RepID=UPI00234F7618|nr:UDP-GalNAc:beta-1,3-N-acetylgalactosaminyltransferase 2-like [Mercenaria mercenaria]